MDVFRSKRWNTHQNLDDGRPAKRISTPAGQRLSVVLDDKRSKSSAAKISATTTTTYCNDPTHQHITPVQHGHKTSKKAGMMSVLTGGRLDTPRESNEDQSRNGSKLSVSVWSDKDDEKFGHVRLSRHRGIAGWGRKRIALVAAIVIALIIALAVGLAVGLKKKDTKSSPTTTPTTTTDDPITGTATDAPAASGTSTLTPSALPSGFPVGSHSFVLFLDTVTTSCASDPSIWTCAPNTDYYSDPQKALTVLNWEITGSKGAYKISSKGHDATFDTTFQNEKLALLDEGKDTERYRFQISRSKTVNMTGTLGKEKGDFECDYGATSMSAFLYTKMQRTYPDETVVVSKTGSPAWPFAMRVEQTVAGGKDVPSCKSSSGDEVSLKGQDATTLCSCLYKNWTPAK